MKLNKMILKKSLSLLLSIGFLLSTVTQAVLFDDIDFSYISQNYLRPSATVITKKTGQRGIAAKLIDANMHPSYNSTLGNLQEVSREKCYFQGVDSRTLSGEMNQFIDNSKSVPASTKERIMAAYKEDQAAVLLQDKDFEIKANNTKYGSNPSVKPFEGVTTAASLPKAKEPAVYALFENIINRLNDWQNQRLPLQEHILATVPIESINVTTYDGVCRDDWFVKYNSKQLNDITKDEIGVLDMKGLLKKDINGHKLSHNEEQELRDIV